MEHTGPLSGLEVVQFGSTGPGPFRGMLLADVRAEVVHRGRRLIADEKTIAGWETADAVRQEEIA